MDRIERIRQSFVTRKTEHSDTHDHIVHHDPEFHKHKQSHHHDHFKDHDEDMADISIESLIIFLHGLKKDNPDPSSHVDIKANQKMAKAINAYNTTAHKDPVKRYTYLNNDEQDYDPIIVDQLINDLTALKDAGYTQITLLNADGFLESIEKTVEKIKSMA